MNKLKEMTIRKGRDIVKELAEGELRAVGTVTVTTSFLNWNHDLILSYLPHLLT